MRPSGCNGRFDSQPLSIASETRAQRHPCRRPESRSLLPKDPGTPVVVVEASAVNDIQAVYVPEEIFRSV